jgi:transcription initiation factor IIE alpha subunit
MTFMTMHIARVALAVRDQAGTSTEIARRARINERTTRKCLQRLMADKQVERIHTWPMEYHWVGTTAYVIEAAGVLSKIGA